MHVPKSAFLWVLLAGAAVGGWIAYFSAHHATAAAAPAATTSAVTSAATSAATPNANNAAGTAPAGTTLYITIVTGGTAATSPTAVTTSPTAARTVPATDAARARQVARPTNKASEVVSHEGRPSATTTPASAGLTVIAHDGAIVFIGDNGRLTANTGAATASGIVAMDSASSSIGSGSSTRDAGGGTQSGITSLGGASSVGLGSSLATTPARAPAQATDGAGETASAPMGDFVPSLDDRAVSIAGYEDHSVNVVGNDQVATYDDSNVFLHRDGLINANTGDTDSSGLNAVDITSSVVRSGASTDGDEADDSDDDSDGTDPDSARNVIAGQAGQQAVLQPRQDVAASGTASSVDSDAATTASGRNPLVIGGDGFDNLAIHSTGNRNLVTYDDSNLVIGGSGKVNAQIGDSDTGGAVVMGIDHSDVEAGPSS
jgi:hypothetical protein